VAFFEDLGKKVSQTGQDAVRKTKIMAETSKLNSRISAEKRVIGENYLRIGEKYFELFCDSPDENLAGFVAAIQEAQQRITDLEDQIKKLKSIGSCPNCGAELKDGALFCTVCGTKLTPPPAEPAPQPAPMVCRNCGAVLPDGSLFCSNCGTKAE
jgi:ribosomal protein L40E